MTLATALTGLTVEQKLALLERVKDRLIALHNEQGAALSPEDFAVFTATWKPKMERVMLALSLARNVVAARTTYDSRFTVDDV